VFLSDMIVEDFICLVGFLKRFLKLFVEVESLLMEECVTS
jgi:hypothetical protein